MRGLGSSHAPKCPQTAENPNDRHACHLGKKSPLETHMGPSGLLKCLEDRAVPPTPPAVPPSNSCSSFQLLLYGVLVYSLSLPGEPGLSPAASPAPGTVPSL